MAAAIRAPKAGPKAAPTPGERPSFVLGSRPPSLRAKPPGEAGRIKPLTGQTQYGKPQPQTQVASPGPSLPTPFGG